MRELTVPKITTGEVPRSLTELIAMLNAVGAAQVGVDSVNWPDKFPYAPAVSVRMAHTGNAILLLWRVSEQHVRAMAETDNGSVWDDSCVEFFLRTDQSSPYYYNVECNCGGTLLIGRGTHNRDRVHASADLMAASLRFPTISTRVFDTREAGGEWMMGLYIPVAALFADDIDSLDGRVMTGNFYKCGDALPQPHFLSWNPIDLPRPYFHCPDYFGTFRFE